MQLTQVALLEELISVILLGIVTLLLVHHIIFIWGIGLDTTIQKALTMLMLVDTVEYLQLVLVTLS